MRTIICFIYELIYLLVINIQLKKIKKMKKKGEILKHDEMVRKYAKKWAQDLLKVSGVKVEVEGLDNIPDETVLIVCNHQGYYDIPVLLGCLDRPYGMVAKHEIKKIPFISKWMEELNCVFIERGNGRKALEALKIAGNNLEQGYSMVIFPEGTRSKSENMGRFKHGAFKLAVEKGVPIIPVAVNGTYKVLEKNGFFIKPSVVKLKVLELVSTKEIENTRVLSDKVRAMIEENIE